MRSASSLRAAENVERWQMRPPRQPLAPAPDPSPPPHPQALHQRGAVGLQLHLPDFLCGLQGRAGKQRGAPPGGWWALRVSRRGLFRTGTAGGSARCMLALQLPQLKELGRQRQRRRVPDA